mmetsp:Transcript_16146/g.11656  ORF Transcript_16146/g.11656 Transcript_16146/m.11656 type:complete len:135 (-) Transcript_16146:817-1221(-)|eukprot:CAMPEP_0202961004 /NCGR_PEP_ID=MMETSP1396-20130829/5111_1 /ASSEMBLY_ACC=CAM_ASM_000872 /TAXON_ID= /ORGANISM="Pseudokeronopsis sp., Strain Brazil" /LENGTH=134 /DNA_ID=CAMNT_0049680561 /DNA_START=721 /DNA_END=1125 /DNA_ORIENTATION=+
MRLGSGSHEEIMKQLSEIYLIKKDDEQKHEVSLKDYLQQAIKVIKEEGEESEQEQGEIFKVKGKKKVIEISFQMCSKEDDLIMMMINDLTTVKNLEKSRQLEKMKTVYFCSVAHDLRTPINSIQATNDYMLTRF